MAFTHIPFASMPWQHGTHPLEKKKTCGDHPACVLEFAAGFSDPSWCERAHVLYVVEGALGLELGEVEVTLHAGECAVLDGGTRHRAKNAGNGPAVVFAVTDANP